MEITFSKGGLGNSDSRIGDSLASTAFHESGQSMEQAEQAFGETGTKAPGEPGLKTLHAKIRKLTPR